MITKAFSFLALSTLTILLGGCVRTVDGRREAAKAALVTATLENPDLTMPHVMLGSIYKDEGEYRGAADQFEQAVRLDPYGHENYYNLGVSYQFLNRLQEADLRPAPEMIQKINDLMF